MKILFFVGEFPKLSQTFILNQITGMIDAGQDVKILAKRAAADRKVHPDVEKYKLMDHVIYYGAGEKNGKFHKGLQFLKGALLLAGSGFFRKAHRSGLPFGTLIRYPNLILLIRTLSRVDLSDREVIIAHFGPNGVLAQKCLTLGLLRGRLFTAFHGYDMLRHVKQKGTDAYRELFHSPAVLLPISDFWRRRCIELGADPNKIIVHHMGIDLLRFDSQPSQAGQTLLIVSAARLVEKKGLAYGIDAVGQLVRKGYSVRYLIAGDGPLKETLQEQIDKNKLGKYVQLLGWKTQNEWITLMKDAQVVLAPSVTASDGDMEGIPVQLMEAMAMRKLVVSTWHSGIPELIRNGENGYLVAEKNADALAEVLERIIRLPEKWNYVTEQARRTVARDFNIQRLNEDLLRVFRADR